MASSPRFSIGIDLGTSNCALAYVDATEALPRSRVLPIPQLERLDTASEFPTLPSFLYYPRAGELASGAKLALGRVARNLAATAPERVIHSAKSWLCHAGVDRLARILPWASDEIPDADKLSPIAASAELLLYLRDAWDRTVGAADPSARFDLQDVTITVPASFDAVAQRLTLDAAQDARYPASVRLLEEPQAAFHHWLERHGEAEALASLLAARPDGRPLSVLVCDIGGGTSDFSLFEISPPESPGLPASVRRVAVSDHILLGGDNMDHAVARALEPLLSSGELPPTAWRHLVARSRDFKERALSEPRASDVLFPVAIPAASGSRLVGAMLRADVPANRIQELILDGFFPFCGRDERPSRHESGLREIGLPYAADSAIPRHLAGFLRGRPVDAVLFNGGALAPAMIKDRLRDQLAAWQDGRLPAVLDNPEPDLAVARGAAWHAWALRSPAGAAFESGSNQSLYIEVAARRAGTSNWLCVLPLGTPSEHPVSPEGQNLRARVNQPVQFQVRYSHHRPEDRAGDLIPADAADLLPLPPLQTVLQIPSGTPRPANDLLKVRLEARLNALGLLRVACAAEDAAQDLHWQLEFRVRNEPAAAQTAPPAGSAAPAPPEALSAATDHIDALFSKAATETKPRRLVPDLEDILKLERDAWPPSLLRALWPPLNRALTRRNRSVDHEVAWLSLAGFVLRPGWGVELDEYRINELWRLNDIGLAHGKEPRVRQQAWVLWRRVTGGLDAPRQAALYKKWQNVLKQEKPSPAELVRLVGALERLPSDLKLDALRFLLKRIPAEEKPEPLLWALGRILGRVPLYAGPEAVLPAALVAEAWDVLRDADWTRKAWDAAPAAIANACRISPIREHNVPADLRDVVLEKLHAAEARPRLIQQVREFVPLEQADRVSLFGDSLPPGLLLG